MNPPYVAVFFNQVPITVGLYTTEEFEARLEAASETIWALLIAVETGNVIARKRPEVSEKIA